MSFTFLLNGINNNVFLKFNQDMNDKILIFTNLLVAFLLSTVHTGTLKMVHYWLQYNWTGQKKNMNKRIIFKLNYN